MGSHGLGRTEGRKGGTGRGACIYSSSAGSSTLTPESKLVRGLDDEDLLWLVRRHPAVFSGCGNTSLGRLSRAVSVWLRGCSSGGDGSLAARLWRYRDSTALPPRCCCCCGLWGESRAVHTPVVVVAVSPSSA